LELSFYFLKSDFFISLLVIEFRQSVFNEIIK
jgi:hypothetical protein